jgi:deoxyribose-phosphate aldolase
MDSNSLPTENPVNRPAPATYEELAQAVDLPLLRPELSDQDVADGIGVALEYGLAAVVVRPSDVDEAVRMTEGSGVATASVAGFPHGSSATAVKLYEIRDLLRRGAREVELSANLGKLISRQFQYVEMEIYQAAKACHEHGATLKVILEMNSLAEDLKVIALKICRRAEADFVRSSSGFAGGVARPEDLVLMKRVLKDFCRVKASGGVYSLDSALDFWALGADRIGSSAAATILAEWRARLSSAGAGAPTAG